MPKIDLHRHLEGSLRLSTLVAIAQEWDLEFQRASELGPHVQISPNDPYTVSNFLSKFAALRGFYLAPEIIQRVTREAVEDAARDNIQYLELRFTPVALSRVRNFPLRDTVQWVLEASQSAALDFGIQVNLIASVNRNEPPSLAEQVLELAVGYKDAGIVGLDLAGDEVNFPADPFMRIFQAAKQEGLYTCIHAGEWSGAGNVAQALEQIQADRIGHGIRVLEDPHITALARQYGTPFEVCLTSNLQSGVVQQLANHPIRRMLENGLCVTLNTDDPGISGITLSHEFEIAQVEIGLSPAQILTLFQNAVSASFLTEEERQTLALPLL